MGRLRQVPQLKAPAKAVRSAFFFGQTGWTKNAFETAIVGHQEVSHPVTRQSNAEKRNERHYCITVVGWVSL